jgi:serine/threonine protein kinase
MSSQFPAPGATIRVGSLSVKVESVLAHRPTSVVFKCTDPRGAEYALKAISIPSKSDLQSVLSEHKVHDVAAADPHVVQSYGCSLDQKARVGYILLELCTSTLAAAHAGPVLLKQELIDIFQRICAAVEFMHRQSPPIIHRDISADNILLSPTGWKLSGFGSATTTVFAQYDDEERVQAMAAEAEKLRLRPPELRDLGLCRPLSTKLDVWALGALLFRLCTGQEAAGAAAWPADLPIDERLQRLADLAMAEDPDARPTVQQLMGGLYADFPQLVHPRWGEFVPAGPVRELSVRPRRRLGNAPRRASSPIVGLEDPQARALGGARRQRHHAMDLSGVALPFATTDPEGLDQASLLAITDAPEEAPPPSQRRVRRAQTEL